MKRRLVFILLLTSLFGFLVAEVFLNLTPPISKDALSHHLALPKLWLEHGVLHEFPWAEFSYYPSNIDLLYFGALYLKNDLLPKFIHFAFAIGTALLIYGYLKKRLSETWGLLGALIFFSTPIIVRLSTSAYIDLGITFFCTASLLAFVRWRDGEYQQPGWLIASAVLMGLAAGSKYNAFISWLFLNLVVVFFYSRDQKNQKQALKYGGLFFGITLLVVSPWLIKNLILTANPVYPRFDRFFEFFRAGSEISPHHVSSGWTIFQRRSLTYGEGFWDTVLIPIRMFFQGRDDSGQFFDGVLNPILIIAAPFAFLKKHSWDRDKIFFAIFSGFFFFSAYFLTASRIRYILPVIPFLAILSTVGLKTAIDWGKEKRPPAGGLISTAVLAVTFVFIFQNVLYLKNRFELVQPGKYITGRETREEFLTRRLAIYPAISYINKNLPDDTEIFLMFLGRRGYYLDRPYRHEISYGMATINALVEASADEAAFRSRLASLGYTHILMRTSMFQRYLGNNFPEETITGFLNLAEKYWKLLYEANGYAVYEISEGNVL